jgi:hypothetical protein
VRNTIEGAFKIIEEGGDSVPSVKLCTDSVDVTVGCLEGAPTGPTSVLGFLEEAVMLSFEGETINNKSFQRLRQDVFKVLDRVPFLGRGFVFPALWTGIAMLDLKEVGLAPRVTDTLKIMQIQSRRTTYPRWMWPIWRPYRSGAFHGEEDRITASISEFMGSMNGRSSGITMVSACMRRSA